MLSLKSLLVRWHVGILKVRKHVEDVGRILSSPKKISSIFLPNPPTGTESASVQNTSTCSNVHSMSPATVRQLYIQCILATLSTVLSQSSRKSPKKT